jgi:hypothetical protein
VILLQVGLCDVPGCMALAWPQKYETNGPLEDTKELGDGTYPFQLRMCCPK